MIAGTRILMLCRDTLPLVRYYSVMELLSLQGGVWERLA